jgi:hypothetical protein
LDRNIPDFDNLDVPVLKLPPNLKNLGVLTRTQSRKLGKEPIEHIIPTKGKKSQPKGEPTSF